MLISITQDVPTVRRFLQQDWCTAWRGWENASRLLENCHDDSTSEEIALSTIQDFSRISLQNVDVQTKSDFERRQELEQEGKYIGIGLVHGNNECCADSLLQLLAKNGYVRRSFFQDTRARQMACQAFRAHLVHHDDATLHPRQRTDTGAVVNVTDQEHNSAFLQHDVHANEMVDYFTQSYAGDAVIPPEGLILKVYTRWDSAAPPFGDQRRSGCSGHLGRRTWIGRADSRS